MAFAYFKLSLLFDEFLELEDDEVLEVLELGLDEEVTAVLLLV